MCGSVRERNRTKSLGVSHEVLRGAQGASHVALGKSGLHAHCEGERLFIFLGPFAYFSF